MNKYEFQTKIALAINIIVVGVMSITADNLNIGIKEQLIIFGPISIINIIFWCIRGLYFEYKEWKIKQRDISK